VKTSPPSHPIVLTVPDRESRDRQLEEAVDEAIQAAIRNGRHHGVLVTRLDHRTFTVELTDAVPYGTTEERDLIP
jgi:hypothetical protein